VATLLGSTGLHLAAAVMSAQAGVGPTTSAVPPPLQDAALGAEAYPVDMSAPPPAWLEALPMNRSGEATASTLDRRTPAPVLVDIGARQPIRLFPAWLYGGVTRHAALPEFAADTSHRVEAILMAAAAPPLAADMPAREPILLFPAGLYGAATRHAALADFAGETPAWAGAVPTETTAATLQVQNRTEAAAPPVTADMHASLPIRLLPGGLYGGVIRHAALPGSAGDAWDRAEALLATGTAAAAPQVGKQPAQPGQAAAPHLAADTRAGTPMTLSSVTSHDAATEHLTLPERDAAWPAHAVLPGPLTVVLDGGWTEVDEAQVFADSRPLASADLEELRGGVFDVDGWKIAFGVNIDVRFDQDFKISSFLNPVTNRGGFTLNVGNRQLVRNEDGSILTQGNPVITSGPSGRRFDFGDFVANVRDTDGGFDLNADGERPVVLSQNPAQVVQLVGSDARTIVRHQLSPGEIIAQLNNVQNNTQTRSFATVAIDILNHNERVGVSRTLQRADQLNRLVVRDLMGRIGR
jgi:hypothetical protein